MYSEIRYLNSCLLRGQRPTRRWLSLAIDSMTLLEALTELHELRKKAKEGYTKTDTPG